MNNRLAEKMQLPVKKLHNRRDCILLDVSRSVPSGGTEHFFGIPRRYPKFPLEILAAARAKPPRKGIRAKNANAFFGLSLFTLYILCFSCMMMFETPAADTDSKSSQKINDFYLSNLKEDGKRDWEMKGKEATIYDKHVDINKMEAKYYSNNDVISIKSEKAELNKENMNANLKENVELKIPDKEGGCITINCSGPLEMKYNDGIAIFNNNVVVDNKEGKLFCDKATVFFDAKDRTKLKIVAQGHVKIVKDDNIAFCDTAIYKGEEKSVTLEGNPKVIYFSKKDEATGN